MDKIMEEDLYDDFNPDNLTVPDEGTRIIQAAIYKRLMQKKLTVDQLQQWKDYIDEYIVISTCDACTTDLIAESGDDVNTETIEKISMTILRGCCDCETSELDEHSVQGFKLVHLSCMKEEFFPFVVYLNKSRCDFDARCSGHLPTPLHIAIHYNQLETVKLLINCGVGVNYSAEYVDSPLAVAMATDRDELVEILLGCKHINVNGTHRGGNETLLQHCVRVRSKYVARLLKMGADPNLTGARHTCPLGNAVQMRNVELIKLLIQHGADVNLTSGRDDSQPLLIALYTDNSEVVEILLEAGADPNCAAHEDGNTALLMACYDNQIDIVNLLLRYHASVSKPSDNGYTPLHIAAWNGHIDSVRSLLKAGAQHDLRTNDLNTPIALAAHGGHLPVIEELLPLGCTLNNYDKDKDTPLHYAAYNGMTRAIELFVELGANPNCHSTCNVTPLWNAVYRGKKEVVKLLIKLNVELGTASIGTNQHSHTDHVVYIYNTPRTPLWVAMDREHPDIALLLVSGGYDVFREDWLLNNDFPAHFNERMCNLLLQYVQSPPKLIAACRNYFRRYFGLSVIERVEKMDIPATLKKYLTLAELQYQVTENDTTVALVHDSGGESESEDEW